jgi:hypothetical protein
MMMTTTSCRRARGGASCWLKARTRAQVGIHQHPPNPTFGEGEGEGEGGGKLIRSRSSKAAARHVDLPTCLRKVDKHVNLQPTKAHLKNVFYFFTSPLNNY